MSQTTERLSTLSMSHLLALRDLGRDDLRRALDQATSLETMLVAIKLEIERRGNSGQQ